MGTAFKIEGAGDRLAREQAADLRRSVLCGELHLSRALVEDGLDQAEGVWLGLAWAGDKPVATLRLRLEGGLGRVEHLAVLPSYRRQGLASALLLEARQRAVAAGALACLAIGPSSADPFFVAQGFLCLQNADGISAWQWNQK